MRPAERASRRRGSARADAFEEHLRTGCSGTNTSYVSRYRASGHRGRRSSRAALPAAGAPRRPATAREPTAPGEQRHDDREAGTDDEDRPHRVHPMNRDHAPDRTSAASVSMSGRGGDRGAQWHVLANQGVHALQFGVVASGRMASTARAAASSSMPSTRAVLAQIASSLRPAHGAMLTCLPARPTSAGCPPTPVGQRLVLGHQRRRRDVRHHEARLEARLGGEEHVQVRVDAAIEQVDAPLGDAGEFGDRDREKVAHEADRLGVEVAAERMSVPKMSGLSETPFAAAPSTWRACSSVCSTAPNTCGMQRTA